MLAPAALALALAAGLAQPADQPLGLAGLTRERIAPGITRILPPGLAPDAIPPSFALAAPVTGSGPAPVPARVTALVHRENDRQVVRIGSEPGTSFYGTGEVSGPLLRNGRRNIGWNTDAFGYNLSTPSLYQTHPWVLAVRADGSSFGVLVDSTWRCDLDLRATNGPNTFSISTEGPAAPVYIVEGPTPKDVLRALARLTGTIDMPPLWALGYHQCRYSYTPDERAREIARGFRSRDIPCDVLWFDIDYMRGYRVFTFDPATFPDPSGLNAELESSGFRTVWMIDPGIKAEPGYDIYDSGTAGDHWVKRADGSVYQGAVWPGMCVFPDYTRPETRAWWAELYKPFMATGIDGVWNDMNEPAVFATPTKTMPEDNLHRAGGGLPPGPHAQYHNVYGLLMAKATLEGVRAALPDRRPFVLTRASFLGGHRYAATWTGDNTSSWYHLEDSVPMILNLGLSGQPFSGPDIGGFVGNGPGDAKAKGELFARWMGVGSLLPFARGHTAKGNMDKEPWAFGPEVERVCRLALQRRYRLIPFLYTLFREAATDGIPVARPVFFADLSDPALRAEDDAFLLGDDLLVVPSLTPHHDRVPVLPRGTWRPIELVGEGTSTRDLPRLLQRAGSIIPLGPVEEHTGEKPLDPLTLSVCLDDTGFASGTLYEDAGEGYGYRTGEYLLTRYEARAENGIVTVTVASTEGAMKRPARAVTVSLVGTAGTVTANGSENAPIRVPVR